MDTVALSSLAIENAAVSYALYCEVTVLAESEVSPDASADVPPEDVPPEDVPTLPDVPDSFPLSPDVFPVTPDAFPVVPDPLPAVSDDTLLPEVFPLFHVMFYF